MIIKNQKEDETKDLELELSRCPDFENINFRENKMAFNEYPSGNFREK